MPYVYKVVMAITVYICKLPCKCPSSFFPISIFSGAKFRKPNSIYGIHRNIHNITKHTPHETLRWDRGSSYPRTFDCALTILTGARRRWHDHRMSEHHGCTELLILEGKRKKWHLSKLIVDMYEWSHYTFFANSAVLCSKCPPTKTVEIILGPSHFLRMIKLTGFNMCSMVAMLCN